MTAFSPLPFISFLMDMEHMDIKKKKWPNFVPAVTPLTSFKLQQG